jgi:hypothetical protein
MMKVILSGPDEGYSEWTYFRFIPETSREYQILHLPFLIYLVKYTIN